MFLVTGVNVLVSPTTGIPVIDLAPSNNTKRINVGHKMYLSLWEQNLCSGKPFFFLSDWLQHLKGSKYHRQFLHRGFEIDP